MKTLTAQQLKRSLPTDQFSVICSASMADLEVGEAVLEAASNIPPHAHEHALLFIVLHGAGRHIVRDTVTPLHAGAVFYVPSGQPHALEVEERTRVFSVELGTKWLASQLGDDVSLPLQPRHVGECRALAATLRAYRALRHARGAVGDLASAVRTLVLEVAQERGADHDGEPAWLKRARVAIANRARNRVDMTRIAAEVGVHPVHLSRTFRRVHGMPATHFLRDRRLELATRALLRGDRSISVVALEAGFTDHAHFSRVFRRAFQFTPSELVAMARA